MHVPSMFLSCAMHHWLVVYCFHFLRNSHGYTQSVHVVPPNERGQLDLRGNPYQLDRTGSDREADPGAWLLPYWMARWSKLL